jgi:hypothetical protein
MRSPVAVTNHTCLGLVPLWLSGAVIYTDVQNCGCALARQRAVAENQRACL